ncbi:MAG: hypothetical protein H0X16_01710 [Chloroflexi bacterium]|nr:hypothetical protein [Chloroflexota bacterium]
MAETEKERVDRELIELLNEIRVALPGVQVLFAFLLILPFTDGFGRATELERYVYFGTLIATAAATALLIAPSSIPGSAFGIRPRTKSSSPPTAF